MQCPRCRGLMVPDQFFDLINDGGYWTFDGWRCLCCGNILDRHFEKPASYRDEGF